MEKADKMIYGGCVYVIIYIIASLPIACSYVMSGGDILIWLARIEEVRNGIRVGEILMYPSAELTVAYNAQISALNTNLWLMIPVFFRIIGFTITNAYRVYMLLLNLVALLCAKKLFEQLFERKSVAAIGALLYMTSPYRIYICYDKANLGQVAAWSLIPLVIWGMIFSYRSKREWLSVGLSGIALAAVGYADGVLFIITLGISMVWLIYSKKAKVFCSLLIGGILYLPGAIYMLRYLLKGGMEVWRLPLSSISESGYRLGQFFSSWTYRSGCPGLGMGLMIALANLVLICFVEGKQYVIKKYGYFVILFILCSFMSMQVFPWDVVQRVGALFLRLIPLMETPGICFGYVSLAAGVLGAYGIECTLTQEKLFHRVGVPIIVVLASIGVAVYMCNTLTYSRVPMFLIDSLN